MFSPKFLKYGLPGRGPGDLVVRGVFLQLVRGGGGRGTLKKGFAFYREWAAKGKKNQKKKIFFLFFLTFAKIKEKLNFRFYKAGRGFFVFYGVFLLYILFSICLGPKKIKHFFFPNKDNSFGKYKPRGHIFFFPNLFLPTPNF